MAYRAHTVSIIIPVHNEGPSIGRVVMGLRQLSCPLTGDPLVDDIIVCNNASTDDSVDQAIAAGAHVFNEKKLGYGAACLKGISKLARNDQITPNLIAFVDGDYSVKSSELSLLLDKLIEGHDLVVGNRVSDLQETAALSPHQQFGNYLASRLIRFIWRQSVNDLGPFRAIKYSALTQLDMQDQRFGWTVEMQVKAIQAKMSYCEVPVSTMRRIGVSKISGTVKGTIGAAIGIFGKIFSLYMDESVFLASLEKSKPLPK